MPGFFTDYASNKLLDLVFGAVAYTPPATLYIGLSQGTANKAGSITEPSGGSYARVAISNTLVNLPAASGGTKSNIAVVNFPAPTGDWGTVQSLFVADAATAGDVLAMADLTQPKALPSGSTAPKVANGAFFLSHT